MLETWQNLPLKINPTVFSTKYFSLYWYSICYLLAFATTYFLLLKRVKNGENRKSKITKSNILDLFSWLIFGLILGGRIGYIVFYNLPYFLNHPIEIISPFSNGNFVGISGMSFHGGLIGTILAGFFFCKKNKLSFLKILDFVIPTVPIGYFWGRIGNFLGGELFGRETTSPVGMHFTNDETTKLRHPSQLYEALGEGILIFIVLWHFRNNEKLENKFLPIYLILYGIIRFFIEFFRQPDLHLGLLYLNLSLGQWLCIAMIFCGIILFKIDLTIFSQQKND